MTSGEDSCSANFDCLRISLPDAEQMRSWSSGEVVQDRLFDAQSGAPIEGGLYCESIFGVTHDWKCQCGKLRGEHEKDRLCHVGDQFPSFQPARQLRVGHIELAMPVVHPLFYLGQKRLPDGDVRNPRNLKGHLIRRRDMFWNPRITVCDDKGLPNETHYIEPGFRILVDVGDSDTRGQKVAPGEILAEATTGPVTHRDMEAVGFERLVELLHLLRPKNAATLAPVSGFVEAIPTRRDKSSQIQIRSIDGIVHSVNVRRERVYCVALGDRVRVGDRLVNDTLLANEICRYLGIEVAQQYLVTEIEHVFRDKLISIDGRHIEPLVSQMFRNVEILDSGDSQLLPGALVSRCELQAVNQQLQSGGSTRLASGKILLQSIGAAGRTSESELINAWNGKSIGRRLGKAAIQGQSDSMTTLRANELTGWLIHVGTKRSSIQTSDHF